MTVAKEIPAVAIEVPGFAGSSATENPVTLNLLNRSSESIYTHSISCRMYSRTQPKISSLTVTDT